MNILSRQVGRIARQAGLAAAACVAMLASSAWAEADDPPGRVGRLSDVTGQVWLYSPDAGEWITAPRNRPLTTGDRLSTEAQARVEVHIGSTVVRLDSGTELEVLRIDDERVSLQLHSGTASVRLRHAEAAGEFELLTDEGRFEALRAGRYRFDRIDEASHVTVWSGQARYEGPGSALTVEAGQRAEFWLAAADDARYAIVDPVQDTFASWNDERDRSDDRSASTRYVSPEMTGVEDLDRYGRWEQAPDYGSVWIPHSLPSDWAPYRVGHWAWISPWGWTWVDDAPWGFAPFHYGRWAMFRNSWCWVPGSYVRRPVYAPALVAWVGGPQLSVSISIGGHRGPGVGWFPLAPREVFVPGYRVSPRYVRNVNITHVTHITNVTAIIGNPQREVGRIDYRHRKFPHAVTVVPRSVMTKRQPVAPVAARWRNSPAGRDWQRRPNPVVAMPAAPARPAPVAGDVRRRAHESRGPGAEVIRRAEPPRSREVEVFAPPVRRERERPGEERARRVAPRPVVVAPAPAQVVRPVVRPVAPATRPVDVPVMRSAEPRKRAHEAAPPVAARPALPATMKQMPIRQATTPQPMLRGPERAQERPRPQERQWQQQRQREIDDRRGNRRGERRDDARARGRVSQ